MALPMPQLPEMMSCVRKLCSLIKSNERLLREDSAALFLPPRLTPHTVQSIYPHTLCNTRSDKKSGNVLPTEARELERQSSWLLITTFSLGFPHSSTPLFVLCNNSGNQAN